MNRINEGGIGRNIAGRAFRAVPFGVVLVSGREFLGIVSEITRDVQLDVTVIVNQVATLGKTGNTITQAQADVIAAVHLIAVDEFDGVVTETALVLPASFSALPPNPATSVLGFLRFSSYIRYHISISFFFLTVIQDIVLKFEWPYNLWL